MRFTRWDQVATSEETDELIAELALRHCREVGDHSTRTQVSRAIREGDLRTLCTYELDYAGLSAEDSRNVRQALAFYSKRKDLTIPGVDRRKVAYDKFVEAEALCRETNSIFRSYSAGEFQFHPRVEAVLYRAQRKISRILGRVPFLSEIKPRFGPGATTQIRRRDACPASKLGQAFACSRDLAPLAQRLLNEMQGWSSYEGRTPAQPAVEIHRGKLNFVPKSAKTDRCVVVEPSLNTMFQLGIGDHIANRLLHVGIDITDQERNKSLAKEGSITGALATLDLSSASDTISRELVYSLLPIDWAHFLARFRTSEVVTPDGVVISQEKFSSMGNGFTFPLETLIFYALAYSSTEESGASKSELEKVSVYGDDIIVPVAAYHLLTEVLHASGFIPNRDKSFSSGPFRESCGADYYLGTDIRPFYLKGPLSGQNLFVMHNFFVRNGDLDSARLCLSYIDQSIRLFGPDGHGDGHLVGDHHMRFKAKHLESGFAGYTFDTFVACGRRSRKTYAHERVLPIYSIYASAPSGLWRETRSRLFGCTRRRVLELSDSPSSHGYDKDGFWSAIPGTSGYKRISVYTWG